MYVFPWNIRKEIWLFFLSLTKLILICAYYSGKKTVGLSDGTIDRFHPLIPIRSYSKPGENQQPPIINVPRDPLMVTEQSTKKMKRAPRIYTKTGDKGTTINIPLNQLITSITYNSSMESLSFIHPLPS